MSETDRIIGGLQEGFKGINKRLDQIEKKIEPIATDYHGRKYMQKILQFLIGAVGGFMTYIASKFLDA